MALKVTTELLDGCVLGVLSNDDYYGYALTQKIQESISVSSSTIYPVMRRLKKQGLVTVYDSPYQGRNRRYYKITDDGKNELKQIIFNWKEFQNNINKLMGDE
ncbi:MULTISPECIES: PadR family transcriptional regulator [Apilactobacillus]|uniref:PadR family transcriptional regulator n=2 Tax=Apilactobacillus TaxID=2767877 RepID=A0A9Q8MTP1_9LACO|nr:MULTISPECIES: PadR family transcriptional regulator [Apilactobacillus]TPR13154.1 PadR family transcriptional regulator [Apilactobacillus timberlakei]TPR14204.1 PadR family transcriptional regulator [Apilactobacillus timberlakei]TPR16457.1 PadR family transcriptional regulator [Apilactobacillus timberlakei]TPR19148.1 PadR family transcriptional regulator [Apilactobacillus timberlakei]TPR19498.1 PadR family transcriptional regulator [Apilactobacillus timberlakei]